MVHRPKGAGSIPSQGPYPDCGSNPQLGHIGEGNQLLFLSHIGVSLPLPLPLSLKAMNIMSSGEDDKKNG